MTMCRNHTTKITLNGEKLKRISTKIRNNTRIFTFFILFNILFEELARPINERDKGAQIEKYVKLPLYADNIILSIKVTTYSTRKLLL